MSSRDYLQKAVAAGPLPRWDSDPANVVVKQIPLDVIDPNPEQARRVFDEDKLLELASNILARGLKQLINVSPCEDASTGRPTGRFYVVAGERRVRAYRLIHEATASPEAAAKIAARLKEETERAPWLALPSTPKAQEKWSSIPAMVEPSRGQLDRLLDGISENAIRENVAALDEADKLALACEVGGLEPEQLASKLGVSVQKVRRSLQLASAPSLLRQAMTDGLLVTKRDDSGRPLRGDDGAEQRERRRVEDPYIALEFVKLYNLLHKGLTGDAKDKKARAAADTRFAAYLDDALARRWSVRTLEELRKSLAHPAPRRRDAGQEQAEEQEPTRSVRLAFTYDTRTLTVRCDRLDQLTGEQKADLLKALDEVRALLT